MFDFYRKNKEKIMAITAVIMAFSVAIISVKAFGMMYQSNDDATLANIAAGAYGSDTLHMVYVNVLFSLMLRPLYAIYTANWYVFVQLFWVTISIAAISYILMKKMGFFCGIAITVTLLTAFTQPIYYTFQYTECAFIILTGGILILADNLGEMNKNIVAGILLAFIGTLIRWDVFYAVGGLSSVLLLYKFFNLNIEGKKKAVVTMVMLFAVTFSAKAVDVLAYKLDPQWNEFVRYNEARTAYSDYKVYQLSATENPFQEYGISDTDYTMLAYWNYYDSEMFTTELMEEISKGNQQITVGKLILNTYEQIKDMMHGDSYRNMFLLIIILSIISLRPKFSSLSMMAMYGIFGVLMLYLMYRMRIVSWVEMGLIWTVSILALYHIAETGIQVKTNAIAIICMLAVTLWLCVPMYHQLYFVDSPVYAEWSKSEEMYFEAMTQDEEHIYLLATQSISNVAGYDVKNPREEGFFANIVAYGGWLSRAPHRDRALAEYGLKRPLVDAVDNPRVFLDYHYINEAVEYVSGQLGKEIYAVKTGDNLYAPYQLVSQLSE